MVSTLNCGLDDSYVSPDRNYTFHMKLERSHSTKVTIDFSRGEKPEHIRPASRHRGIHLGM